MRIFLSSLLLMLQVFIGCKEESTRFRLVDPDYSGVTFSNTLVESDTFNALKFEYIYNGAGVGIADFNND
ncbi:MAG TPA: hypothetical protein VFU05_10625, partial [Cyclobacteriaceae bacterium]|nr:hypothetical protein [Cyclobacteriaceae bacterium]